MSSGPENYFGGTPTWGYAKKKKSILQGIIDDAKQSPIYKAGEAVVGAIPAAVEAADTAIDFALGGSMQTSTGLLKPTVEARAAGVAPEQVTKKVREAKEAAAEQRKAQPTGLGAGPVGLAMGATEAAWSYGVARPASTVALATDPGSPLYTGGEIEQVTPEGKIEKIKTKPGFQWDDLAQAWRRSEEVSYGKAAAANPAVNVIPGMGVLFGIGGVSAYDPWSSYDMSKAQDNPYYRFITGSTDFALAAAVPPAGKVARLTVMDKAGLRSTVRSEKDLIDARADWDFHKEYEQSGGTSGHKTAFGLYVDEIAPESNPAKIRENPFVANAEGVDKAVLSDILARTNDKDTVANIMLATWGDQVAMRNVMDAAPDHVWALSDMDSNIQNLWLNGERFMPRGAALDEINQVFDSAIARDSYFTELRDMFTRSGMGEEAVDGLVPDVKSTWKPTKSIIVEKTRIAKGKATYAARTADYSDSPRWVQKATNFGPGSPTTIFLQWVGSRQPLGYVTKSGARPNDIMQEVNATFDSLPQFRGTRSVVVGYQQLPDGTVAPISIPATQYRQNMIDRLTQANMRGTLLEEWRLMEDEIVTDMARTLEVDPVKVQKFVQGYRQAADEAVNYLKESGGYLFDERGGRVLLDPQTQRQLLNSFPTTPLRDVYDSMRYDEAGVFGKASRTGIDGATMAFDAGLKFFRTNVLFRPGYTGKNSIIEPLLSSWLAHGTILADEGLGSVARNFAVNRKNMLKRAVYVTDIDRMISRYVKRQPVKTRRQLRRDMQELLNQREQTKTVLDEAVAELDNLKSGRISPSFVAQHDVAVRGKLVDAQLRLEAIEAALDGQIPEWRQVVEPARLTDIRAALAEYESVAGRGETGFASFFESPGSKAQAYITSRHPNMNEYRHGGMGGVGDNGIVTGAVRTSFLKDFPGNATEAKGVASYVQKLRSGEGFTDPIMVEFDPTNGRFYVGEGNHRLQAALQAGEEFVPVRVVRSRISDNKVKYVEGSEQGGRVGQIEVPASPWKGGMGEDYWPTDIHPSFLFGDNAPYAAAPKVSVEDFGSFTDSVVKLRALYDDIVESTAIKFEDPARKIELAEQSMELIDKKLAAAGKEMGFLRARLADTKRYAGSGEGYMTIRIGGEDFQIPSAFSERAYDFGAGYRAEASAAGTNRLTLDPSYRASYEVERWQRTGQMREIDPNDPIYFDELAHVVNRFFRGDPMVQIYLETGSRERVAQFLSSKAGREYQKRMGKKYLEPKETYSDPVNPIPAVDRTMPGAKDIAGKNIPASALDRVSSGDVKRGRRAVRVIIESTTELDELLRIVDQYLPTSEARRFASVNEVTPGQLQQMLSGQQLSRIAGEDMMFIPGNAIERGWRKLNAGLDKLWQWIATMPEDRVARWPFYQREFRYQMQRRSEVLASQGVKMTNKQFAALRQASHRDALAELEKTFYNIRRYNSVAYMSRFLMSFPGAFFNSIYRYGRFTAKEPERVFQSLLISNEILKTGAIDEDGNPVDKISDAAYFVIPGTRRDPGDTGQRIPIGSLTNFAVNYPGLSYASTVMVSAITAKNPKTEELLRSAFGSAFDEMFPYGIPRNWEEVMLGSYQKDLIKGFRGESDEQFVQTSVQIFANNMARWERNGMIGDAPTFTDAVDETRAFYFARSGKKAVNSFSLSEQPPGQLMRDSWYAIKELYPDNPEEARRVYMEQYGEWARWYTYSSGEYSAYLPSTQDAYQRVWVDFPELTRSIVSLVGDDGLEYVSLLGLGTDGQFSQPVSNYYRENPLPGDDQPVVTRMNPEQFNNMVRADEGWGIYSKSRILFDTEMTRLRQLRDDAKSESQKDVYRDQISNLEDGWRAWVQDLQEANPAWGFDFNEGAKKKPQNAALVLRKIMDDPKFKDGPGRQPLWQNLRLLIDGRQTALDAIRKEETSEGKAEIRRGFVQWVNNDLVASTPELVSVWERYFSREWTEL